MFSTKPVVSGIVFALTLSFVSACATGSTVECPFDPVYTNAEERAALRPQTLLTIDTNNAVWLELGCGDKVE